MGGTDEGVDRNSMYLSLTVSANPKVLKRNNKSLLKKKKSTTRYNHGEMNGRCESNFGAGWGGFGSL